MDLMELWGNFGYVMALSLSAAGSALGTGAAGMATIGAWKKCILREEPVPFILVTFVSMPLSQTIYGIILMNALLGAGDGTSGFAKFAVGLFGGLAIASSAYCQGRAGAMAADALAETKKGMGNYIMVLGVIETVALFVMVFLITTLN